jgi:hypothetical protein
LVATSATSVHVDVPRGCGWIVTCSPVAPCCEIWPLIVTVLVIALAGREHRRLARAVVGDDLTVDPCRRSSG